MRALVRLGSVIAFAAAIGGGCGGVESSPADATEKPTEQPHATPPMWDKSPAPAAETCETPAPLHVHHDDAGRVDRLHVQLPVRGSLGEFLVDTGSLKSFVTRSDAGTDATADTTIFCRSTTLPIIARLRPGTTPEGLSQAGVLGSDLVAHGSVLDLDLLGGHLSLYEPAPARPAGARLLPVEYRNGWLVASGIKIDGRDVKLIVDTGASNVIVVGKTPRLNEVREDTVDGTASAITLFHGVGEMEVGDGVARHVPVDRTDAFPTLEGLIANLGGDVAGLLGLTAMGRERIIIGKDSLMLVLPPVSPSPL
ncbi:MAG: hypothetical protein QOI41_639 [Myxococcales bacterium]|nr:hypothetical protein [Myxococcales bacterium]